MCYENTNLNLFPSSHWVFLCVCVCVCVYLSKLGERSGMWQQAQIFPSLSDKTNLPMKPTETCTQAPTQRTDWKLNWQHYTDGPPAGYKTQSSLGQEFIVVFFTHSWPEGCRGIPDGLSIPCGPHGYWVNHKRGCWVCSCSVQFVKCFGASKCLQSLHRPLLSTVKWLKPLYKSKWLKD